MAFTLPTFNLNANIWRVSGTGGNYAAPDVVTLCNLSPGRRVFTAIPTVIAAQKTALVMELLLPKLTDIRSAWNGLQADLVEVPAGSKRFYGVNDVDDIGKGFVNEHRFAILTYVVTGNLTLAGGPFPAPVPLP
jgi:hypothetical protein